MPSLPPTPATPPAPPPLPGALSLLLAKPLVQMTMAAAALLLVVLVALLFKLVDNIRNFHRATQQTAWDPARSHLPIRRQHRQVEFLVGRWREPSTSPHDWAVRFWQVCIWGRQIGLLTLGQVGASVLFRIDAVEQPFKHTAVLWLLIVLVVCVLGTALLAQLRFRPYAHASQNAVEAFLLVCAMLILLFLGLYNNHSVSSSGAAVVQAVMLALLVGSLLGAAAFSIWDANRQADSGWALSWADRQMNRCVRTLLKDGTIRLVRCKWLLDSADAYPKFKRLQDLQDEALASPEEACKVFDRADRSVLILSHPWRSPLEPDPDGITFKCLHSYLAREISRSSTNDMSHLLIFIDFCSLP